MTITDEDMETIVRMALESRRRVKEQQKRVPRDASSATRISAITLGVEGVEQFVSTPELHSDEAIESDPLPPGQVWTISPGGNGSEAGPVSDGSDGRAGRRRENPERARAAGFPARACGLANKTFTRGRRNWWATATRAGHEFSVQLRAMDTDKSGQGVGLPVLVALCGALIERSIKGGLIIVGSLNLGGSVEMIPNPVAIAELAVEKGAATLLMPISARKQLFDLPDALATKISIEFYADAKDAFLKALVE